jgi:hypothetical protein
MADYCNICGSLKFAGVCSNRRLHDADYRSRCWLVDGTEYVFRRELTRAEAVEAVRHNDITIIQRGALGYVEHRKHDASMY